MTEEQKKSVTIADDKTGGKPKSGKTKSKWKKILGKSKKELKPVGTESYYDKNQRASEIVMDGSIQEFLANIQRKSLTASMLPQPSSGSGTEGNAPRGMSFAKQVNLKYLTAAAEIVGGMEDESKLEEDMDKFDESAASQPMKLHVTDNASLNLFKKTMGMSEEFKIETLVAPMATLAAVDESGAAAPRRMTLSAGIVDPHDPHFESQFAPDDMRCLALVAHNHMKPAMKEFVLAHQFILRKFRLTGTATTMTMLRDMFGDDPTVRYGPTFTSGPLGGDAELCALMCLEDLGGCFFFMDPLDAHPHQADIDCLVRLANVHNILTCINPCTAHGMCVTLMEALKNGRKDMIPSFFCTLKSPGVAVYKDEQKKTLNAIKNEPGNE